MGIDSSRVWVCVVVFEIDGDQLGHIDIDLSAEVFIELQSILTVPDNLKFWQIRFSGKSS